MNSAAASDDDVFDLMMTSLDAPVAVVTTAALGERAGCLIGFHAQCSISPRHSAIWLSKANYTYRVGLHADHFAVHWLTEEDRSVAELFGASTGDEIDKFAHCEWESGPADVPLLTACPNRMVGRRIALLSESSDHVCMVLEPVLVSGGRFRPLRLSAVSDIDPGHGVDERPEPPSQRAASS
jgi:flavin reductase (DIM6/NTAB) family NADH-FMN oxidoreductase RutF